MTTKWPPVEPAEEPGDEPTDASTDETEPPSSAPAPTETAEPTEAASQSEMADGSDVTAGSPETESGPADDGARAVAPEASEGSAPPAETAGSVAQAAGAAPEPFVPRTVAGQIAAALHAAGVKFAFTVPGESFLPLLDAFVEAGVRVVATRHESGAAFMAEAYGQLTGRPAACIATRAVGAANLAIGIHTARADSTPMFALVGQVERAVRGREAFQEVDQAATFGRLAKWATEIDRPDEAIAAVSEAVRQALLGRPGPVLLAIPEDVLDEPLETKAAVSPPRPGTGGRLDPDVVRASLQLLAAARRPVILAGAGVLRARASKDLLRLAELLHVPIVASWRRGDVVPNEHPLYLGMTGSFAPRTVRHRLADADALLVIGCRLNEVTTFGYSVPRAGLRWAHVDLEPRVAGHGLGAPDLTIAADAGAYLRTAIGRLERAVLDAENVAERDAANAADRLAWEVAAIVDPGPWAGEGLHPGRIVTTLAEVLPDNAILTTDAGNFGSWLARGFRFRRPGTFLGPTSGAMGYALPAAISASIVHRDRPVVALAGDGGFAMTMAELETAVRERAQVIALVFDNGRYGTIRMHQDRRSETSGIATDLGPIAFADAARAFGARAERIEDMAAFESGLRAAIAADGPTVLHLPIDRSFVSVDDHP